MSTDVELMGGRYDCDHWRVPHGESPSEEIHLPKGSLVQHRYRLGTFARGGTEQQVYRWMGYV